MPLASLKKKKEGGKGRKYSCTAKEEKMAKVSVKGEAVKTHLCSGEREEGGGGKKNNSQIQHIGWKGKEKAFDHKGGKG